MVVTSPWEMYGMPGARVMWAYANKTPKCRRCDKRLAPGDRVFNVSYYPRDREKRKKGIYYTVVFHPECFMASADDWYKFNPYEPKETHYKGRQPDPALAALTPEQRTKRTRLQQRMSRLAKRINEMAWNDPNRQPVLEEMRDIIDLIELLGGAPRSWRAKYGAAYYLKRK